MIRTFWHKGLRELFEEGQSRRVDSILWERCRRRLDVLNRAVSLGNLDLPGFNFHRLKGKPQRYSIHVSGTWCITFEWIDGDAYRVDLEQYH